MKKATIIRLVLFGVLVLLSTYLLTGPFSETYFMGIAVIMSCLTVLWILSLIIKDASIIDIFWGVGFVITVWTYANMIGWETLDVRAKIFVGMVSLWGLRLGIYLGARNIGKGEDYRYKAWREENGKNWWWLSYIRVFVLQGFILWIVSSIFVPALSVQGGLGFLEFLGIGLWAIGLFFEAVGDWQLSRFKRNPGNKGKVMDTGLWKYTRHPNYFGDALMWWGLFCFCLGHPQGLFYIFSPIFMTLLLLKVSGVAMLERKLKESKPKYKEYMEKTSAFVPMMPKK